jgi:branched-chain amino acid aminotransferase
MMTATKIPVSRVQTSKLDKINLENLPFSTVFTDHMLEADFIDGEWTNLSIKPYQNLSLSPATAALHYGQAIFEGIKAFKKNDGKSYIFRPHENFLRFNKSAARMQMPEVPEEIFMDGMIQLVNMEKNWIPEFHNHSLYIRPFMFSCDDVLGVRPSSDYKFLIILSPSGPYYSTPMKIWVEEEYVRASPGGVGYAKAAGNYGAAMYATAQAKKRGYDQVLWMDAIEHKYVQECGTMNVFFIIDNTAYTPSLEQGTILEGVTRNTVMTLLGDLGYDVVEKQISIQELVSAYKNGSLKEAFGTGTAATITFIEELGYEDITMKFDINTWKAAPAAKKLLMDIREGDAVDKYGWMLEV